MSKEIVAKLNHAEGSNPVKINIARMISEQIDAKLDRYETDRLPNAVSKIVKDELEVHEAHCLVGKCSVPKEDSTSAYPTKNVKELLAEYAPPKTNLPRKVITAKSVYELLPDSYDSSILLFVDDIHTIHGIAKKLGVSKGGSTYEAIGKALDYLLGIKRIHRLPADLIDKGGRHKVGWVYWRR